jgi:hypothetical protein
MNPSIRDVIDPVEAFDHPHVVSDHDDGSILLPAELSQ